MSNGGVINWFSGLYNSPSVVSYSKGEMVKFIQDWICTCGCGHGANKGSVLEVDTDLGHAITLVSLPGMVIDKVFVEKYQYPLNGGWDKVDQGFELKLDNSICMNHDWVEYIGFTEVYKYCKKCDKKDK